MYLLMTAKLKIIQFISLCLPYDLCVTSVSNVDCLQKCSSDVFLEGLFLPCLGSGMIGQLLEQLQIVDPSMNRWLPYLTASCKHLSRNKQIHTLYELQLYMKVRSLGRVQQKGACI